MSARCAAREAVGCVAIAVTFAVMCLCAAVFAPVAVVVNLIMDRIEGKWSKRNGGL